MTAGRGSISETNLRGTIGGSLPPSSPSTTSGDSPSPPYSTVVESLSGAQGTISVISALQASFLYAGLSSVQVDDFDGVSNTLSYR